MYRKNVELLGHEGFHPDFKGNLGDQPVCSKTMVILGG
jgi:hypothetical protein